MLSSKPALKCMHLCVCVHRPGRRRLANQVSNANPFASPSPALAAIPCATFVTRSPWGVPALLFGEAPGLLTADNSTYSDATLCCGGVLDFTWTVWRPRYTLIRS